MSRIRKWWSDRTALGRIGWPLLAFVVIASIFTDSSTNPSDIGRYGSIELCEDAVRERLKAPSTAEFSDAYYRAPQSHLRIVGGQVDAENAYGAKLRKSWVCTLRLENDAWYVDEVAIP